MHSRKNVTSILILLAVIATKQGIASANTNNEPPPYLLQVRGGLSILSNVNGFRLFPELNGPSVGGSVGASFHMLLKKGNTVGFYFTPIDIWAHFDGQNPNRIAAVEATFGLRLNVHFLSSWLFYLGGGGGMGGGEGVAPTSTGAQAYGTGVLLLGIGYRINDVFSLGIEPVSLRITGQNGMIAALYYGINLCLSFGFGG